MAFFSVKRSLIVILPLMVALAGLTMLPSPAAADYYEISAYIDSDSYLIIKDNTMQWYNKNGWPPGQYPQFPASDPATYITTSSNPGVPIAWNPDWLPWTPADGPAEVSSSVYTGLTPALPQTLLDITLTKIQGRDNIWISQNPSADNAYTLIIEFNDGPTAGAAWYTARVDFAPVPVPGTVLLLGSGLLGLGLPGLRRRLKRG